MIGLTQPAGKELATTGVVVTAIAPAVIATPMHDGTGPERARAQDQPHPDAAGGRARRRSPSWSPPWRRTG